MRRSPLRLVPPPDRSNEPGRREWKASSWGDCAVCGQPGRLERHHVVLEQHVRKAGGDPWDLRNAMALGMWCRCHREHHQAAQRISLRRVPDDAIDFAAELFGAGAGAYLSRFYSP